MFAFDMPGENIEIKYNQSLTGIMCYGGFVVRWTEERTA